MNCVNYNNCVYSSQTKKTVRSHIWQGCLDRVNEIRHTREWKEIYPLRSQTIERVFGDAKEKHGMRYTQRREKKKVGLQVLLTFACINLKKLANWKWEGRKHQGNFRGLIENFLNYSSKLKMLECTHKKDKLECLNSCLSAV